jgi:predicted ATPase
MLIERLTLSNLLSFGPNSEPIHLGPLNVIIGPNGSGKSNLIEAVELLHATPTGLANAIRSGGGIDEWLWKGETATGTARIDGLINGMRSVSSDLDSPRTCLRYRLQFTVVGQRMEITDEAVEESEKRDPNKNDVHFFYRFGGGNPTINVRGEEALGRRLRREDFILDESVLFQRKDPDLYPELTWLGRQFSRIRTYREWNFGRSALPRLPQKADLPNDELDSDARNLGLVLNRLRRDGKTKARLLDALKKLYEGIDDYDVQVEGGTVQLFFYEGGFPIPATRLSDGTLRYLSLLAVLLQPNPPPLICIEEPELGLHPDLLATVAQLLKEGSERSQLIVTTHSDLLVDAMSDMPESVLICERRDRSTSLRRLSRNELQPWLERYRLGELWTRGDLGGTR